MQTRYFALIIGIVFVLVGIAGFIPGLLTPTDGAGLSVTAYSGRLLGLFPVNVLHSLVHLAIGVWGVIAWRRFADARLYSRALAIIYGVLTVMGLIPMLDTTFGLVPLYGHDVWLHAATAVLAIYFGWFAEAETTPEPGTPRA